MNDYNKQLEETIAKQASIIETLSKDNEALVSQYNELAKKYNTVADLLNACGVKETKMQSGEQAWCLTMQVGAIPNPQEQLKETGIDTNVSIKPVKQDGDKVVWGV